MRAIVSNIVLFILLFGISNCIFSQEFEGKIIYRTSVENANPERISDEQFKMMFQDIDTIAVLYLSQNQYKLETLNFETNKCRTINQYDPITSRILSYMAGDKYLCWYSEPKNNSSFKPTIYKDVYDTITILGHKCSSVTLDYGVTSKAKIYYSEDFRVDKKSIENDNFGFLDYIYECEALPLKIIMLGNGAIHNLVYTAMIISAEKLKENAFKIPKFKEMKKSPF
jgi:hypothetical protein